MHKNRNNLRRILFLGAIILTFFAWSTLLKPGYFSMHDDMQAFRLLEMDRCWQDGQFPCRWVPDGGFGYGYPLFNYYPPLPFYLGQILHLLGFSIINSVKLLFILGFFAAAAGMFLLGNSIWGPWGGLVASVFYTYAPYHALDIYARGALNEFWALSVFPFIFWAIYQYIKEEKNQFLLWFALSYGLLFLSHNLMVLIFTPLAVGWLFLNLILEKKMALWKKFVAPSLLAVGLAAFFLLPVLAEKKLVHLETIIMGYFGYLVHFVNLKQLFFDRSWGYGASVYGPEEEISFQIGWLHWGLAFLVVFSAVLFGQQKKDRSRLWLASYLLIGGLGAAFMTHSRSTFIWKLLEPLKYLQFPWRFLSLVIFCFSLLVGGVVTFAQRWLRKPFLIAGVSFLLISLVIGFNFNYFKEDKWFWGLTDQEKFTEPKEWEEQVTSGIFDYLPQSAAYPPAEAAPAQAWLETGVGQVTRYQKGTDWLQFNLRVDSDQAQIRVPIYDFPNWEIKVNGVETDFDSQNELGLPTFALPSGEYRVTARLTNTPIRTVGNWLSLFSWGAFLILIFKPEYLEFSNHSDHRRIKNKNWRKKIIRLAKT